MQKKSVEKKNFQRMCVVCRNRFDKNSLTRFAVRDGKVVVDKTGNAEGRGAYVCDNPDCMLNLVRKKHCHACSDATYRNRNTSVLRSS